MVLWFVKDSSLANILFFIGNILDGYGLDGIGIHRILLMEWECLFARNLNTLKVIHKNKLFVHIELKYIKK